MGAWATVDFPARVSAPLSVLTVEDAVVTRFERGPLRSLIPPFLWTRGAVYDADGRLVPESQRLSKQLRPGSFVASDPEVTTVDPRDRLEGGWLYGGNWMGQFGHFLVETLANLWPCGTTPLRGVLFHSFTFGPQVRSWQQELLDLGGLHLERHVVTHRPVRVEELLVPSRAFIQHGWSYPEATTIWDRIMGAVGPGAPDRVFLSRARFHQAKPTGARTTAAEDAYLDQAFTAGGFRVVYPEQLSTYEQVQAVTNARVIAGVSGTALHLAAFARRSRVLELGDPRTPDEPLGNQVVISALRGHEHRFVPYRPGWSLHPLFDRDAVRLSRRAAASASGNHG